MNQKDEKYRIKPRKKYQRQVWLKDGKAIIVDPIEKKRSEDEKERTEELVIKKNSKGGTYDQYSLAIQF